MVTSTTRSVPAASIIATSSVAGQVRQPFGVTGPGEPGQAGGVLLDRGGHDGVDRPVEGEGGRRLDRPAGEGAGPEGASPRVRAGPGSDAAVPGPHPDPGAGGEPGDQVVGTTTVMAASTPDARAAAVISVRFPGGHRG